MIAANNVTYRVGKKALFEDVNIKFTEGNCYGLIGANGAGKSTFLKILDGQLDTTSGTITVTPGDRISFLEQDHFKYDEYEVLDTVIMGNRRLYDIMKEKDALYMKEDFTDEDGIKAAELEGEFAEMNGWEAESDAESLLNGLGIETELHHEIMGTLGSCLPRLCSAIRISCSLTSRPTTWIWAQSSGWRSSSSDLRIQSSLSPTTVTSSTRSAHRQPTLTMERSGSLPATMISGSSPHSSCRSR